MKKISISVTIAALLMVGCSDKPKEDTETKTESSTEVAVETAPAQSLYGVSPDSASHGSDAANQNMPVEAQHVAVVLESMNAAGYTYAKVEEDGKVYWIAGPQTTVANGTKISFIEQMVMENFTSKALDRTFDYLVFASTMIPVDKKGATSAAAPHDCDTCGPDGKPKTVEVSAPPHGSAQAASNTEPLKTVKVAKNANGYTVEDLHTKSAELNAKEVKVNAQVVKVSKNIMGKDWVHIQDGSGSAGTNDIVITALNSNVQVGDIVTATGTFKTNVDFGYGYKYAVIIEDAKFTSIK